jgi:hypothetical protein
MSEIVFFWFQAAPVGNFGGFSVSWELQFLIGVAGFSREKRGNGHKEYDILS